MAFSSSSASSEPEYTEPGVGVRDRGSLLLRSLPRQAAVHVHIVPDLVPADHEARPVAAEHGVGRGCPPSRSLS